MTTNKIVKEKMCSQIKGTGPLISCASIRKRCLFIKHFQLIPSLKYAHKRRGKKAKTITYLLGGEHWEP